MIVASLLSEGDRQGTMTARRELAKDDAKTFKKDWARCLAAIKKANPAFQVADIETAMERLGWIFDEVEEVVVEY